MHIQNKDFSLSPFEAIVAKVLLLTIREPISMQTITMQQGAALISADQSITSWKNVPNPSQQALRKAVDDQLREEQIPAVNVKVIDWRMAQVIKDTLKKNLKTQPIRMYSSTSSVLKHTGSAKTAFELLIELPTMDKSGPSVKTEAEIIPSTPSSISPTGQSRQYYDPVRGSIE